MRGVATGLGSRIPNCNVFLANLEGGQRSFAHFSSSSGRGRGTGAGPSISPFSHPVGRSSGKSEVDELNGGESGETSSPHLGRGHGRGNPLPSDPVPPPPRSSFISTLKSSQGGAGRGQVAAQKPESPAPEAPSIRPSFIPNPIGAGRGHVSAQKPESPLPEPPSIRPSFTPNQIGAGRGASSGADPTILTATPSSFPGRRPSRSTEQVKREGQLTMQSAGRGKSMKPAEQSMPQEENRHVRVEAPRQPPPRNPTPRETPERKFVNSERGNSIPQGKGKWKGEFKGNQDRRRRSFREETQEDTKEEQDVLDSDIGKLEAEKFAQRFGVEVMNEYEELFKQVAEKVVPSPEDEEFIEALHSNSMIEFEPEYLMNEFNSNPDLDEKSPISLQDFLEKVKPFMMPYMGLETHEEWEEAVEEVITSSPNLKKIVDFYSGPDRVTAKTQEEELKKLQSKIPPRTPKSLKHFVDRAALSLQSNPGWGHAKKYQFMNKLVREIQLYK